MRLKRCKDCKGTGKITFTFPGNTEGWQTDLCDTCGGSGYEEEQTEKFYGKLDFSG